MGSFFDLVLVFIFIVLPVISNLIKAGQKRGKGKNAPKRQQKPQAGRTVDSAPARSSNQSPTQSPTRSPTQAQTAQPVVARQAEPQSGSAASSKADFERRLAEARARVQQSMSDGGSSSSNPQANTAQANQSQSNRTQTRQQPNARQAVPSQQARPQTRSQARTQQRSLEVLDPLGGKTAKAKSIESGSLEGRSLERQYRTPSSTGRESILRSSTSTSGSGGLLGVLPKKKKSKSTTRDSDKLLTMDDKSIMRGLIWKQILDTPKSKKRISNYNRTP